MKKYKNKLGIPLIRIILIFLFSISFIIIIKNGMDILRKYLIEKDTTEKIYSPSKKYYLQGLKSGGGMADLHYQYYIYFTDRTYSIEDRFSSENSIFWFEGSSNNIKLGWKNNNTIEIELYYCENIMNMRKNWKDIKIIYHDRCPLTKSVISYPIQKGDYDTYQNSFKNFDGGISLKYQGQTSYVYATNKNGDQIFDAIKVNLSDLKKDRKIYVSVYETQRRVSLGYNTITYVVFDFNKKQGYYRNLPGYEDVISTLVPGSLWKNSKVNDLRLYDPDFENRTY